MNEEIKIEKNIPMPVTHRYGKWVAIIREMEVGDSFFVKNCSERQANSAAVSIRRICGPGSAARRKTKDGIRFWRLK